MVQNLFIYLNIINEISEHSVKNIFTLKNIIQIILFISKIYIVNLSMDTKALNFFNNLIYET